jgi:hypothetical protein
MKRAAILFKKHVKLSDLKAKNISQANVVFRNSVVCASISAHAHRHIPSYSNLFAFGLSAKLMPKALELLFSPPHPPLLLIFF